MINKSEFAITETAWEGTSPDVSLKKSNFNLNKNSIAKLQLELDKNSFHSEVDSSAFEFENKIAPSRKINQILKENKRYMRLLRSSRKLESTGVKYSLNKPIHKRWMTPKYNYRSKFKSQTTEISKKSLGLNVMCAEIVPEESSINAPPSLSQPSFENKSFFEKNVIPFTTENENSKTLFQDIFDIEDNESLIKLKIDKLTNDLTRIKLEKQLNETQLFENNLLFNSKEKSIKANLLSLKQKLLSMTNRSQSRSTLECPLNELQKSSQFTKLLPKELKETFVNRSETPGDTTLSISSSHHNILDTPHRVPVRNYQTHSRSWGTSSFILISSLFSTIPMIQLWHSQIKLWATARRSQQYYSNYWQIVRSWLKN